MWRSRRRVPVSAGGQGCREGTRKVWIMSPKVAKCRDGRGQGGRDQTAPWSCTTAPKEARMMSPSGQSAQPPSPCIPAGNRLRELSYLSRHPPSIYTHGGPALDPCHVPGSLPPHTSAHRPRPPRGPYLAVIVVFISTLGLPEVSFKL